MEGVNKGVVIEDGQQEILEDQKHKRLTFGYYKNTHEVGV